jgi:hypothetical protein
MAMRQDAEPLKYLPWIGVGLFVVFWGAYQAVRAFTEPARHKAGEGTEVSRVVRDANPATPAAVKQRCLSGKPVVSRV